MSLRVNVEDLVTSGVAVTGHGEDVAMKHSSADSRIESAQTGWQGQSATAMAACSATWLQTTTALLTRLSDHAQGLHNSAHGFSQQDAQTSQALDAIGESADAAASSR